MWIEFHDLNDDHVFWRPTGGSLKVDYPDTLVQNEPAASGKNIVLLPLSPPYPNLASFSIKLEDMSVGPEANTTVSFGDTHLGSALYRFWIKRDLIILGNEYTQGSTSAHPAVRGYLTRVPEDLFGMINPDSPLDQDSFYAGSNPDSFLNLELAIVDNGWLSGSPPGGFGNYSWLDRDADQTF